MDPIASKVLDPLPLMTPYCPSYRSLGILKRLGILSTQNYPSKFPGLGDIDSDSPSKCMKTPERMS